MEYLKEWKLGPFCDRLATVVVGAFIFCVSQELEAGTTLSKINWSECIQQAITAGLPLGATWDFLKFREYKMGKG